MQAPLPVNEAARLAKLKSYEVLDTLPEPTFERVTTLAARLFKVPMALVSLVDKDRQWFKSCFGVDVRETSRDLAFCAHTILTDTVMVVADATRDPRFADNPLVTGDMHIRFYAGAPLKTSDGFNLGSLCIIDTEPRLLSASEVATLADLAAMVVDELELRAQTAQLATLASIIENSEDAIYSRSLDDICRTWNRGAEHLYGYSAEEMIGQPIARLVPPDRTDELEQLIARLNRGDRIGDFETVRVRQDGRQVPVSLTLSPVRDAAGAIIAGATIARDITERKNAGAALRASEERIRVIINTAQEAFVAIDANSVIIDWNLQAEAIFGWSREEALGQPMHELIIPPQYRDAHRRGLAHFLQTGEGPVLNKRFEITAWQRERGEFPVELTISPRRVGNSYHFNAFLHDITERKQAEQELRMATEAAEAATRAKSEFLANMSHEIRTPMNGVMGTLSLLLESHLTPAQRELTEISRASAESLLTIINDILDFSKIEAGQMTIEPVPFDLLQTLEEVASIIAPRAQEKALDLIVRYDPTAPRMVVGDAGRIRQVLLNLMSNAIKFTAQGHVWVNIEATTQTESVVSLRVSVEDTGIGIAADKLEAVFAKFTQADASTTRRFGGTGLGLAISRQLIELMGGSIGVDSQFGTGSTFWFTLQLPRAAEQPLALQPQADISALRILIVDDNDVNRRVLHEQLNNWKLRNTTCDSGEQALQLLRAARTAGDAFQMAILDYQMPVLDGEMLGRAIKADPDLQDTVLLMLSSLGQRDEAHLKEIGFAACLLKPARQSDLLAALIDSWTAHTQGTAPNLITRQDLVHERRSQSLGNTPSEQPHRRVLLVEDNSANQKIAALMLQSLNCSIDVAADGQEAVAMVAAFPYDIVFMDCEMPVMDGFEATALIRHRADEKARLPIVAVTAQAMAGDRERCLAAGMDDYLTKPIQTKNFLAALERWVPDPATTQTAEPGVNDIVQTAHATPDASSNGSSASGSSANGAAGLSLDLEVIANLRSLAEDTDASLLQEICDAFQHDSALRLQSLRQAVTVGDATLLRQAAHALKGASANIGALRMAQLGQELQALGERGTVSGAAPYLDQLEAEFGKVQSKLAAELEKSM